MGDERARPHADATPSDEYTGDKLKTLEDLDFAVAAAFEANIDQARIYVDDRVRTTTPNLYVRQPNSLWRHDASGWQSLDGECPNLKLLHDWRMQQRDMERQAALHPLTKSDFFPDTGQPALDLRISQADHEAILSSVRGVLAHLPNGEPVHSFPLELSTAIEAFMAVRAAYTGNEGRAVKPLLRAWIKQNRQGVFTNDAIGRIATVANWEKSGGAPKTPTKGSRASAGRKLSGPRTRR